MRQSEAPSITTVLANVRRPTASGVWESPSVLLPDPSTLTGHSWVRCPEFRLELWAHQNPRAHRIRLQGQETALLGDKPPKTTRQQSLPRQRLTITGTEGEVHRPIPESSLQRQTASHPHPPGLSEAAVRVPTRVSFHTERKGKKPGPRPQEACRGEQHFGMGQDHCPS